MRAWRGKMDAETEAIRTETKAMRDKRMEDNMKACQETTCKEPTSEDMEPETEHQEKMDAWIVDMNNCRRERTACQEATEANPKKMEPTPEIMQSEVERRDLQEHRRSGTGPASSRRVPREAKGTDPGRLWVPEEVGCRLQEGVPPCKSGMPQEELIIGPGIRLS
jgi:hypothetical protein